MNVTTLPLNRLIPATRNVRLHPPKQIRELVRSIKMFGQTRAIVVDEDHNILAGNGLYLALRELGRESAECYVMTGLTENQKKKLMLADNRVYELGMMDMNVFDEMLRELSGDTDIPGWDEALLKTLNADVPELDEMIGDYGVFDRKEIESVKARQIQPAATPPEEHRSYAPVSDTPAPTPQQPAEGATVIRTIKCPYCGMEICL